MKKHREGFRRLSILIGFLGVLSFHMYMIIDIGLRNYINGYSEASFGDFILLFVFTALSFLIPYLLTKGIHWVISGFGDH